MLVCAWGSAGWPKKGNRVPGVCSLREYSENGYQSFWVRVAARSWGRRTYLSQNASGSFSGGTSIFNNYVLRIRMLEGEGPELRLPSAWQLASL